MRDGGVDALLGKTAPCEEKLVQPLVTVRTLPQFQLLYSQHHDPERHLTVGEYPIGPLNHHLDVMGGAYYSLPEGGRVVHHGAYNRHGAAVEPASLQRLSHHLDEEGAMVTLGVGDFGSAQGVIH